jgi:hypothetical protein
MNEILSYKLIGIGEFSHGIEESWDFRFNILINTFNYILFWNKVSRLDIK